MKKYCFLFGVLAMLVCLSCSSDDSESSPRTELIGTWVFKWYSDYIVESGELLSSGTVGTNLVLNNDNTCTYQGYNGTYSYANNTITFHYKTSWTDGTHIEEHNVSCKIEELTADKLTISRTFDTHLYGNLYTTQCIGYEYYTRK